MYRGIKCVHITTGNYYFSSVHFPRLPNKNVTQQQPITFVDAIEVNQAPFCHVLFSLLLMAPKF